MARAHGDTFHNDRHPDLKADYVLANPPFNVSEWRGELLREDKRWQYGVPPAGNANLAWVRNIIQFVEAVRANVKIDWTIREDVRAKLRVLIKRILRKQGYPADKQEQAAVAVLEQAEQLAWETA